MLCYSSDNVLGLKYFTWTRQTWTYLSIALMNAEIESSALSYSVRKIVTFSGSCESWRFPLDLGNSLLILPLTVITGVKLERIKQCKSFT